MSNVDYQLIFRRVNKELDNEIERWLTEAGEATNLHDYFQMTGLAQGVEKAQQILAQYIEDGDI